jgi:hypothetical protein
MFVFLGYGPICVVEMNVSWTVTVLSGVDTTGVLKVSRVYICLKPLL